MGSEALEIILAEMSVKDLTSKDLKKIDKALDKTKKRLQGAEKAGKSFSKSIKNVKGSAMGRAGARAGKMGRAGIGGGGLIAGLAGIPLVGGAIAAALSAAQSTKSKFVAGLSLKKNLLSLSNNFQAAFNKEAKGVLNLVNTQGGILFREKDIEQSFTALADAGINPKVIEKHAKIFSQYTKSQGFTNFSAGMSALASGKVNAFRGLETGQINRIQALAPLLSDVNTSQVGFERIAEILKEAGPNLKKFADKTETNLKGTVTMSNTVEQMQEKTSLDNVAGNFGVFKTMELSQRSTDNIVRSIAQGTAPVMRAFLGGATKAIKAAGSIAKAISGGVSWIKQQQQQTLKAGLGTGPGAMLVNSIFKLFDSKSTKAKTGTVKGGVSNTTAGQKNKSGASIKIDINVNGGGLEVGKVAALEIKKALNQLAKTDMRVNTGLELAS